MVLERGDAIAAGFPKIREVLQVAPTPRFPDSYGCPEGAKSREITTSEIFPHGHYFVR